MRVRNKHPVSLDEAMALKKADYVKPEALGIQDYHVVEADMDQAVITNPTSLLPVAFTRAFTTCMALAVENMTTHTITLAHVCEFRPEALEKMLKDGRRGGKDALQVHMVGACFDVEGGDHAQQEREWRKEMQQMLDVINAHDNVKLVTFDVGPKEHPCAVGFCKDEEGRTRLVQGSTTQYRSGFAIDHPTPEEIRQRWQVQQPGGKPRDEAFKPSAEMPFDVAFDGREHQDWDRNPKAGRIEAQKAAKAKPRSERS
jgi:hypothetical protein